MISVSAVGTLVPSEPACVYRSRINLHGIINFHKKIQLRSRVVCAVEIKNAEDFKFPSFLSSYLSREAPIKDSAALKMATRIQRLPVETDLSERPIMSSCVMPLRQNMEATPVVLLHGFDSSCLEWRYTYPLLEAGGMEPWAVDLLGWGFNNGGVKSYNVAAKREHLYKFWRRYIKRPMALVGPSLGAAATIDFAVCYPEAVSRLVLIDGNVYAEGTGNMAKFPKSLAYFGVSLLKSVPLRTWATFLALSKMSRSRINDMARVGRLHCHSPHWADATVDFMLSGGYNIAARIKEACSIISPFLQIDKKTLVIWGEEDEIVSMKYAKRLQEDLKESKVQYISECGHIPHVEKPEIIANMIIDFLNDEHAEESTSE
ncbi:alpha/beta hydrolase domain-containing protein VTE7 isoform X2 [Cryptomeria japonica]|uniref:alpha/beta hydrolase domain-containing protein VTE7 isoform X2 n=1 Tax=Cryptomeria japonica TaxID=3369 RepID=UPI0027DAAB59|nr:alpha/beta hydrolase domain-containing protein VTE7 isoform X2 [Cryptomeria japonica]